MSTTSTQAKDNTNKDVPVQHEAQRIYGLGTTIALIVGMMIGSGIFFKADDILLATGGNVNLGIVLLSLGALAIIFGSLCFSEFAVRSEGKGGFVSYYEEFVSPAVSAGFGVFQTFVYLPSLCAVVAWVSIVFICMLLGVHLSFGQEIIAAFFLVCFLSMINILSRKLGAICQNAATILKIVPLLFIAVFGILHHSTDGLPPLPPDIELVTIHPVGLGWLASLAPISFAYDGWALGPAISSEVKNPKKTVPRALIISPIIVLIAYILYFHGLASITGPELIMSLKDNALNFAVQTYFGSTAASFILIFVIIAILGVVNGLVITGIRMPQALAEKSILLPRSVAKIHQRLGVSLLSAGTFVLSLLIWLSIHYLAQSSGVLNGRDVSEIAIIFNYIIYLMLYIRLMQMYKRKQISSFIKGIVYPILASIGSLIIFVGGLISSPMYCGINIAICAFIFYLGYLSYKRTSMITA